MSCSLTLDHSCYYLTVRFSKLLPLTFSPGSPGVPAIPWKKTNNEKNICGCVVHES